MKTISVLFTLIVLSSNILSQPLDKIKISGGLIIPSSAIKGFTANIEYEHQLNTKFRFYLYSGIYSWDKNQVSFQDNGKYFSGYSEDEHRLYPLYIGSRLTISSIRTFTVFANLELGYNFITYNIYQNVFVKDENNKYVISFYTDKSKHEKINESIFGFGVGLGVTQTINENISFMVETKRNTLLKSLDNLITHYYFNAGILISI